MDYFSSINEALDELIQLNEDDYDYWYSVLYTDAHVLRMQVFNEENNKLIWQCVADNLPTLYLAGCYNE